MVRIAKQLLDRSAPLERKLFWIIFGIISICAFLSSVFTGFERFFVGAIVCFGGFIACLCIGAFVHRTEMYALGYFGLVVLFSCIVLPLLYFLCGGIHCGTPIYLLASPFLCAFIYVKPLRFAGFLLSSLAGVATFAVSWYFPGIVAAPPSSGMVYVDFVVSFLTVGTALFLASNYSVMAYKEEWAKREELLSKLDYLSKCDPQTKLYNRSYFVQTLENMSWPQRDKFYVALFDIDNFKDVNDSYGHVFGDSVICDVAGVLQGVVNENVGEFAVRYGGETFLYVLYADSEVEAFTKADKVREIVDNGLRWVDKPMLHITVSGGFVACHGRDSVDGRSVFRKVDELLYESKQNVKNQIRSMVS